MARNLQVKKRTQLCPLFCVASVLHVYPATVPFGTVRVPFWLSQSKEKARIQAVLGLNTRFLGDGDDGSRTRVQKPIPRSSTIIVGCLTFPLPRGSRRPRGFGSFMLRPCAQSLTQVVSHNVDARVPECECFRSDGKPLGCVC